MQAEAVKKSSGKVEPTEALLVENPLHFIHLSFDVARRSRLCKTNPGVPGCHPDGGYVSVVTRIRGKFAMALVLLALTGGMAAVAGCHRPTSLPTSSSSVLLIVVDTLRADRVGALTLRDDPAIAAGSEPAAMPAGGTAATSGAGGDSALGPSPTPEIDRWAVQAARFRRAVTPAPFTMPAMAAMFSGAYPDRSGVVAHEPGTTFGSWPGTTLAEAARKAGLATAAVVANPWLARSTTGFDRGFDQFSRIYSPDQAPGASNATAVTDDAIRILDSVRDRRFLLWVHYFDPHMPYEPPPEFARAAGADPGPSRVMTDFNARGRDLGRIYRGEGYTAAEIEQARRLYDGEVRYADHEIGRLLERLGALGLADDTIVVLASDHGESLGEHGLYFAHDYTLYDELIRVPLLIGGPGVAPGTRDDYASLVDVAPTVCRLAALDCGSNSDGRDLFAAPQPDRTLFAAATPLRARGTVFDRLSVAGTNGRWTMALDGTDKLLRIPTATDPELELYDLEKDPRELANLAGGGEREKELREKLSAWSAEMDASRPAASSPRTSRQQRRDTRALRSLGYLQ